MSRASRISRAAACMLLVFLSGSPSAWGEADPFGELAPNAPETGAQAPRFTAEAAFGNTVTLREELREHNVLLLFYRGVF